VKLTVRRIAVENSDVMTSETTVIVAVLIILIGQ